MCHCTILQFLISFIKRPPSNDSQKYKNGNYHLRRPQTSFQHSNLNVILKIFYFYLLFIVYAYLSDYIEYLQVHLHVLMSSYNLLHVVFCVLSCFVVILSVCFRLVSQVFLWYNSPILYGKDKYRTGINVAHF